MRVLLIDTGSPTPVYIQIQDSIRARVRDGTLVPGAPLPSVRQLASDLAINANTVAKAYMLLEREGIVRTVRRRGTFIAEAARARALAASDQRLDEAVDRLFAETAALGIDPGQFLEAMKRRLELEEARSRERPERGGSR